MSISIPDFKLLRVRNFLKEYRALVFWLIWGLSMSLVFGFIIGDHQTSFVIFMGYGIFLALIIQFVKIRWLRLVGWLICLVIAVIIVWKPVISFFQMNLNQKISRNFLVDDIRQMASILDSAHPDPYFHSGGKIAFNRRMQNLIRTIPENGLTRTEFYHHLCPLLASVGDGHTTLWLPFNLNNESPGGIPLYFQAVEDNLYVAGVVAPEHQHLVGSKLLSVENVPVYDLLKRQAEIKGYDNEFQLKRYLGYDGSLWYGKLLANLIPEWQETSIHVVLKNPEGLEIELNLEPNNSGQDNLIMQTSSVKMPSTEKSNYVYRFMDEEKKTVLLFIEKIEL